jgi:hypothetical protein
MDAALTPHLGRVVVYTVLGDAEAFVFDFDALSGAQRAALVAGHLAAFEANLKGRGRSIDEFPPFALLGNSMPAGPGGTVDLSAPHEGALVTKRATGAVYYVSAADDLRLWEVADSVAALNFRESCVDRVFTPAALVFDAPPTTHTGFTLDEWATAGRKRPLALGKRSGLLGFFERVFAAS